MKRSLATFSAVIAVFFLCACGAGGAQDTTEVLDGLDDLQALDPQAALESAPDPESEEPTAVDVDPTTVDKASVYIPCGGGCINTSLLNLTGICCTCNGTSGSYARSAWSRTTFLCL